MIVVHTHAQFCATWMLFTVIEKCYVYNTFTTNPKWQVSGFFFLISKNVIYTNGYSMHEECKPIKYKKEKTKKKQKKKPIHRLITKRKRAKEIQVVNSN